MAARNDVLKERLSRASDITLSVTGRKSGHMISIPIWFVFDDDTVYLLPVNGSNTQWYKNVLKDPSMRIEVGGVRADAKAVPVADAKQVSSVIQKFRNKYGAGDITKYYTNFDVAVVAEMK
jgi:deazaflavin-dependent oxidoreductase (nitroreductase family)